MAKNVKSQININLPSHGQRTVGKLVFQWAIKAGRTIIILVELIALGALGYRFIIDRQIIDQHDEIAKQEIFIKSQADREKLYRSIQQKLEHISITQENTTTKYTVMNAILQAINSGIFFSTSLSINEKSASFEGTTFSIQTLTNFIDFLKKIPVVSGISLTQVSTTDTGEVQFNLLIEINKT